MGHIDVKDFVQYMRSKLYNFDDASKAIAYAFNAGENILLTGPGGYGKSEAAVFFANYLREREVVKDEHPFVMSFGQGTTQEQILGGIDMKKFQNEGDIIYLLMNSFANYEVVILEELFDAFPGVLLILKDILQAKEVRMGNQRFPLKTKIVIACTNRSHEEVIEDASTEALLQRFAFTYNVVWDSWTYSDYSAALKLYNPSSVELEFVSHVAEEISKGEYKLSPRQAAKGLRSALKNGMESLMFMYGFDKGIVKTHLHTCEADVQANLFHQIRSDLFEFIEYVNEHRSFRAVDLMNILGEMVYRLPQSRHDKNVEICDQTTNDLYSIMVSVADGILRRQPNPKGWVVNLKTATEFTNMDIRRNALFRVFKSFYQKTLEKNRQHEENTIA